MPIYEIQAPDGKIYEIEGPEGASDGQLISALQQYLQPAEDVGESQLDIARRRQRESIAALKPTPEEPDFLDQIEEFGKGIPRGALGLLESAALGGAAVLDEEAELKAREAIQDIGRSAQSYFSPDVGSEDTVGGKFGEALGSFVGLGATAVIPGVGLPAAGALAIGAGAGEASERARAAGATEDERGLATALGAVVGLSELIPLKVLGTLRKGVDDSIVKEALTRVKRAAIAGGAEGAQEAAAGVAQNLIQKGVYDPEQGVFTDTGEAFGYGAGVGGLVQGVLDLALPKSRGRSAPEPDEVTEESVQETLALPYDPSTTVVFEDGSEADVTRSEAEALGLDFDAVVRANRLQQEAIAAEEARIAAIPAYPDRTVRDAVLEDATTEASAIFKNQAIKSQIARAEEDNRNLLGYESRDFVTDAEGNTVPIKQVQDNYLLDEVEIKKAELEAELEQATALANREARPILADQPAPQVIQQRQLADEAQALAAARQELAGRPQTDLFPTQLTAAEAQAARRPAPEPAPEPKQKISQKFLKDIGIAPTDTRSRKTKPIYQRLMAKKEVPLSELKTELKAYVDNPDVKDAPTKAKINAFLGIPENKQIELAFEETETVTPTGITKTTETAETVKPAAPVKADAKPEDREALLASLKGKSIEEQIKILEGRGAPTEFTTAKVVDEQLERGETVSEKTLMEESETRRDVDRTAVGIARDEGRKRNITPAQRVRMLRQMRRGIEPTLEDVDPQLRQEATKATEKE